MLVIKPHDYIMTHICTKTESQPYAEGDEIRGIIQVGLIIEVFLLIG